MRLGPVACALLASCGFFGSASRGQNAGDRITLGKLAGRKLFEMRYLQPGKVAPDIVGEDIDGKPMKLSDFRGKVILLDFWGFW